MHTWRPAREGGKMTLSELTSTTKSIALANGAGLAGVVQVADLQEHATEIENILPGARTVLVVAASHSLSALRSSNNQVAQFDTIYAYGEAARAAQKATRFLESEGFASVAVPAFIPIGMEEPKKGMRGEICWRRAGVRAGLGSYGENGLLVTKQYGAAVRLCGLVTEASLKADLPLNKDTCDHCMRCVEACPSQALSGGGKINKKLCGDLIFKYGFRFFRGLLHDMVTQPTEKTRQLLDGYELRETWQTFMTGNYYYCFKCQAECQGTKFAARSIIGGSEKEKG